MSKFTSGGGYSSKSNSSSLTHPPHIRIAGALGVLIALLCVCLYMGLGAKSAYAVSPGFTQWGNSTVEWKVENGTNLIIQPLDNGREGTMPEVNNDDKTKTPWAGDRTTIREVEFKGTIRSGQSLYGLFYGMEALENITNLSNLDTSQATNMRAMFSGCSKLKSIDLSKFNTSNVLNTSAMFHTCSSLTTLSFPEAFSTSNVTNMSYMFTSCSNLATIKGLDHFDTSKVKDMRYMFGNSDDAANSSLTSIDLSSFNTANVTNMSTMFQNCRALTRIEFPQTFTTSNVTNMSWMFWNCSNLATIEGLDHFDTSKVTTMQQMFGSYGDAANSSLTSIDLSSFNTANVTNMKAMFQNCRGLSNLDLSSFDTANVTDMQNMFLNCSRLGTIYVSKDWNTNSVNNSADMFFNCINLRGGNGTPLDPSSVGGTLARIDGINSNPGYLTVKYETPSLPSLANNLTYGDHPELQGGGSAYTIQSGGSRGDEVQGSWSIDDVSAQKLQAGNDKLAVIFTPNDLSTYQKSRVYISITPVAKRSITVYPQSYTIYVGENIPPLKYTLSDESYRSEITGSLYVEGDTNKADTYEIKTDRLTSDNLDLAFGNTAYLTVNAQPVFPDGGFPGGSTQQPGWVSNDGYWYLFDDNGNTLTGWQAVDNTWYYLNNAGQMQTGWVYVDDTWYYLNTSGAMQTGWFSDTYNWYYLGQSGAMQTGWIYTDDTWYLTDASGAMKTGWEYVGGSWYHLDQTGAMTTGWYSDGTSWYYLASTGEMATGTHSIDGETYTFASSGAWIA